MPRIIVQSEGRHGRVLLTERVRSAELAQDHYARQLVQRALWAAADAEREEADQPERGAPRGPAQASPPTP